MLKCFASYRGWSILALSVVVAGYLVIWHGSHVAAVLPFLVLLACPLMHVFMHGHHAPHGRDVSPSHTSTKGD
jgi:hypothetical protein